ncbi:acyl-CoA thioesterase domain-containing protein [Nocardia sp. XZ_19_231]|uniref:acyl-CoA thioesterase domain-containing protein n=1 Tax=Nocardia sp. XZ_19_231 TaxID=2769252 RepID=UPI0018900A24|nr:acyl-CoA thioesterase domain-containing protein [Nocardia sp. XZ_19_231]
MASADGPAVELDKSHTSSARLVAQVVRAVGMAVPKKSVRSIHVVFTREFHVDSPLHYLIQIQQQTRPECSSTVTVRQRGRVVATATLTLHAAWHRRDWSAATDGLSIPGEAPLHPSAISGAGSEMWIRPPETSDDLAPALIAFATDLGNHDALGFDGEAAAGMTTAHSVWFHRPVHTGRWLLHRSSDPIVSAGRRFVRGEIMAADGSAVASYAREALN